MPVTADDVRLRIAEVLGLPQVRVAPDTVLTDLVAESFRLVEMAIELQEEYDVLLGQADLREVTTVGDLADLVQSRAAPPDA